MSATFFIQRLQMIICLPCICRITAMCCYRTCHLLLTASGVAPAATQAAGTATAARGKHAAGLRRSRQPNAVTELISYVRDTWLESSIWKPANLSAYCQQVRTNNDVEGWHRRLNQNARRGQLSLYVFYTRKRTTSGSRSVSCQTAVCVATHGRNTATSTAVCGSCGKSTRPTSAPLRVCCEPPAVCSFRT